MTILDVRHVGIVVSDLAMSLRFYGDLLGFSIVKYADEFGPPVDHMLGLNGVRVTTVKMSAPNSALIELLRFDSPLGEPAAARRLNDTGISHVSFTVTDLDAEYIRLMEAGVPFVSAPQEPGSARVAFCTDPDGNFVELVQVMQ